MSFAANDGVEERELREMVAADAEVRKAEGDANPVYRSFVLFHEGYAYPAIEGMDPKTPLVATRSFVENAMNKLKKGLVLMFNHRKGWGGKLNERAGEFVAYKMKEVMVHGRNVLGAIGAAYIDPSQRDRAMKAKSVSAEAYVKIKEAARRLIAFGVGEIEAVSLLEGDAPAFSGATELAKIAARRSTMPGENEEYVITKRDVERWIRDNGIRPSQLYSEKDIREDREFEKVFADGSAKIETLKQKHKEEIAEKDKTIGELSSKTSRNEAMGLLDTLGKERNVNGKAVEWAKKNIDRFTPAVGKDAKDLKEQAAEFLTAQAQDFKEAMKVAGVEVDDEDGGGEQQQQNQGDSQKIPGGDGKKKPAEGGDDLDYSKPEHNDLLQEP